MNSDARDRRSQAGRDWWVAGGMAVTAVSAAVSSFSGLRSLAEASGWPGWLAPLLPLTVDAYAMTATRVWLARSTRSARARRFARWNALLAVGLSLVGNGVWHLAEAGLVPVGWPVVLAAGSVPPVVLGLLSHLAVLRGEDDSLDEQAVPRTAAVLAAPDGTGAANGAVLAVSGGPELQARGVLTAEGHDLLPAPSQQAGDGLLAAARAADAEYRAKHDGRPITRDALRRALHVGTARASEVMRELRRAKPSNY